MTQLYWDIVCTLLDLERGKYLAEVSRSDFGAIVSEMSASGEMPDYIVIICNEAYARVKPSEDVASGFLVTTPGSTLSFREGTFAID